MPVVSVNDSIESKLLEDFVVLGDSSLGEERLGDLGFGDSGSSSGSGSVVARRRA